MRNIGVSSIEVKVKIIIYRYIDIDKYTKSGVWKTETKQNFIQVSDSLLEDRVLDKDAWLAKLLGTHLSIQFHKKVKFS